MTFGIGTNRSQTFIQQSIGVTADISSISFLLNVNKSIDQAKPQEMWVVSLLSKATALSVT